MRAIRSSDVCLPFVCGECQRRLSLSLSFLLMLSFEMRALLCVCVRVRVRVAEVLLLVAGLVLLLGLLTYLALAARALTSPEPFLPTTNLGLSRKSKGSTRTGTGLLQECPKQPRDLNTRTPAPPLPPSSQDLSSRRRSFSSPPLSTLSLLPRNPSKRAAATIFAGSFKGHAGQACLADTACRTAIDLNTRLSG